jgi:hypothetical protein
MRLGRALVIALCCFPALGAAGGQETQPAQRISQETYVQQRAAADRGLPDALLWCLRHGTRRQQSARIELEMYTALIDAAGRGEQRETLGRAVLALLQAEVTPKGLGRAEAARLCAALRKSTSVPSVRCASLLAEAQLLAPPDGKAGKQRTRARALLQELIDDYPAASERRRAREARWRLDHLSIGCIAPDFLTGDVDGNELRIRDYRDRVTVVRFLDFREPKTAGLVQRDVHMSERFWDERFALIGIGRDVDPAHFRRTREEWGITWDTAFEHESTPRASSSWHVQTWPHTVVLDAAGVVRAVGLEGAALEKQVAALLREQNTASAPHAPTETPLERHGEERR